MYAGVRWCQVELWGDEWWINTVHGHRHGKRSALPVPTFHLKRPRGGCPIISAVARPRAKSMSALGTTWHYHATRIFHPESVASLL